MKPSEIKKLGRYTVESEIGRGAMGVVYLAADPVIDRTLALKTMSLPQGLDDDTRAEFSERFLQEARAAGGLSHPSIVTVFDAGHDDDSGLFFIAMEYVPGRNLKDAFDEGPLPEMEVRKIARGMLEALGHAHDQGIVHRDLKPANILLAEGGTPKIADFGIARVDGSNLTREGQTIGPPAYMSPEQILGRPVDGRSDLFSLGILLYEALTGVRPFQGEDVNAICFQIVNQPHTPAREVRPELSPKWDAFLGKLLAKPAGERFPDVATATEALDRIVLRGEGSPAAKVGREVIAQVPVVAQAAASGWSRVTRGIRPLMKSPRRLGYAALVVLALAAVLFAGSLLGNRGVPLNVEFKHGLDAGRLSIEVDGDSYVDLDFVGTKKTPGWLRKLDPSGGQGGRLSIPLQVSVGEREVMVRVEANDGEVWTETQTHRFLEKTKTELEVRVGTRHNKGIKLEWDTRRLKK